MEKLEETGFERKYTHKTIPNKQGTNKRGRPRMGTIKWEQIRNMSQNRKEKKKKVNSMQ